jgi:Xaa-Pro aminopeptidase
MFQTFDTPSSPEHGPKRLAALRQEMKNVGVDGFLVPRADAHQGEYVSARDARLLWLTGFSGSAGFCVALKETAGVFIDGRYTVQVRSQIDMSVFTPVSWPATQLHQWLIDQLPNGGIVGFDPLLHTIAEIDKAQNALNVHNITLKPCANLVDAIWSDQPTAPLDLMIPHPIEHSGQAHDEKISNLAHDLAQSGKAAAVLTLADSIAWLLNTRGTDIGQNPVSLANAILHATGAVEVFMDSRKVDDALISHFGNRVTVRDPKNFGPSLQAIDGPVLVDKSSAPYWVQTQLDQGEADPIYGQDPTVLPKACKNTVELQGSRASHIRDGAAVVEFLSWLEAQDATALTEVDIVTKLESFRAANGDLKQISFDTICGTGPNGAIVHYRVSSDSNRQISDGDVLLIDSGGQYLDGTTDITRTLAIGDVPKDAKRAFTGVLRGLIALSRVRFPKGLAGRDLDPLARQFLWSMGLDYDHGTGHGVGSYLSVHEGPQRISRVSHDTLMEGMILSNEPGYYRENAFGIRIENLFVVETAKPIDGGDTRDMLSFETLTFVPIDQRMIDFPSLSREDVDWLNSYHAQVLNLIGPNLSKSALTWLTDACKPI